VFDFEKTPKVECKSKVYSAIERYFDKLHETNFKFQKNIFGKLGQPLKLGNNHKMIGWVLRG